VYSDGGNPVTSMDLLEGSPTGNGAHAAMLNFTSPLSEADVLPATARTVRAATGAIFGASNSAPYFDPGTFPNTNRDKNLPADAARSMLNPSTDPVAPEHLVTDVGLNLLIPVFATDQLTTPDPVRGGIGRITIFDGSTWLRPVDTVLQARILAPSLAGAAVTVWWDVDPADPILQGRLWIPPSATTLFPRPIGAPLPPPALPDGSDRYHQPNTAARDRLQDVVNGLLRDFLIPNPSPDPEWKDGKDLQFLFVVDDGAGNLFPVARLGDLLDPRSARPWIFKLRDLRGQHADVTILHNVINPLRGEKTNLHYVVDSTGYVTITVFDLKGDIVNVLYRGQRAAGDYSTSWDGRNRGGRIVARGIYFIRVVGPGFDEMRKVLVVK
jgi:hypothetical protein